jgi:hypothetical protein
MWQTGVSSGPMIKSYAMRFQLGDGFIEIIDFEGDGMAPSRDGFHWG